MLLLQIQMDLWSLIASLFSILHTVHTDTIRTSKACFGTLGPELLCTRHDISCRSTQKIAICDAYYTDNAECGLTGLSNCATVKPGIVTERGNHSFNNTELISLYSNCSTNTQCVFPAPRRSAALAFSVVKYKCIENQTDKFFNRSEICQRPDEADGNTGAAVGATVGGVVASVLAVLFIVAATVWYLRKRRVNTAENERTSSFCQDQKDPSIQCTISQSHYQDIDDLKTRVNSSDYDYATADGVTAPPNMKTYLTIEPVTNPSITQNPATSSTEDDYDHIGDKPSALTSNYDTTASVAQSAGSGTHAREDDYGYNLLQKEPNTQTVQNDYDTTASANKAVAQLERIDEKTLSSPYDTAGQMRDGSGDFAVAGPM